MIRRLIRRFGWLVITQAAWRNRGNLVRAVDAARRAPMKIRTDRARDTLTELRAVARLATDPLIAARADIRFGSVGDGCLVLLGPSGDTEVERARHRLLAVPGVVDVRTAAQDAPVSPRTVTGTAEPAFAASPR
jgi:hypothetical protein